MLEGGSNCCLLKTQIEEKIWNKDIFYSFELFPTQSDNDSHARFDQSLKCRNFSPH